MSQRTQNQSDTAVDFLGTSDDLTKLATVRLNTFHFQFALQHYGFGFISELIELIAGYLL